MEDRYYDPKRISKKIYSGTTVFAGYNGVGQIN